MAPRTRPPRSRRTPLAHKRLEKHAPDGLPLERIWRRILQRRLKGKLGKRVSVAIHDNTHTMLSYRRRRGEYRVRLHHMFLAAPEPVVGALAEYLSGKNGPSSALLDRFIQQNRCYIRKVTPAQLRARVPIQTTGRAHDLQAVFDELNRRFFRGQVKATITWATVPRAKKVRTSIKLGSYAADSKLIRIHPALDQRQVPRYFVEWVVFHEMLHHLIPAVSREGKKYVHTPEFNARERRYPLFHRARRWEQRNLDGLLRWGVRR